MELPPQLVNWLYNVLQPQYENKKLAYTQIVQFLQQFSPNFKIRTKVYTSSYTGKQDLLINIHGKVSMGTPIEIWIPLNYPYSHEGKDEGENGVPIIYIIPDNNNNIYLKPNNYVDSQGKVFHPYLTDWYQNCTSNNQESFFRFNLLLLMKVLTALFDKDYPITDVRPNHVPPKPLKIPLLASQTISNGNNHISPNYTVSINRENTGSRSVSGPPLPNKSNANTDESIPSKYQLPLPLPDNFRVSPFQIVLQMQQNSSPSTELEYNAKGRYTISDSSSMTPPTHKVPLYGYNVSTNELVDKSGSHGRLNQHLIADLIDKDDKLMSSSVHQSNLQLLSEKINNVLLEIPENSSIIEELNAHNLKVEALYDQLNHHFNQANANKEYLESHLDYLLKQVRNISLLNSNLRNLQEPNLSDHDHVHFVNAKISLDDLVIADSVLTNQLYDIVSDIKANKDTLGLIEGTFTGQNELICDELFDGCVKTVRNIGRDLFWLELIKSEIAKKLNLNSAI